MSFVRNKEDFACGQCGARVVGDGYTNHCPKCLWSRHVDVEPGDRLAECGGMMPPISLEGATPDYSIIHRCEKCGFIRRNKVQKQDDVNAVIALVKRK